MNAKHYYLSVLLLLVATLGLRAQSKTVTLTEAGTLSTKLTEAEQTTITDLTIKGPINSADIVTLRAMAGNLKVLNLLDANIVYSAQSYYGTGNTASHTQNDIIGDYMFYGMTQLTKITLPKDVWSIGTWSEDNPWNDDKTQVNGTPKKTSYSSSFAYTSSAFARCVSLKEVILPDELLWIGPRTFDYCVSLTTIKLPDGLEGIGYYAFADCKKLEDITVPASIGRNKIIRNNSESYGGYTFAGCLNLSNISLAEGLTVLYEGMFNGCVSLKNITLPEGLLDINSAFSGCSSLKTLNIPTTVTNIGSFRECTGLTELIIPDNVTWIEDYAFTGCTSLTEIILSVNTNYIGSAAFYECTSLLSGENSPKQLLLINNQLVTRLIKFFD